MSDINLFGWNALIIEHLNNKLNAKSKTLKEIAQIYLYNESCSNNDNDKNNNEDKPYCIYIKPSEKAEMKDKDISSSSLLQCKQ